MARGNFGSSRRLNVWALPPMIISRLLKSCAMPPVSLPIASIFCAIASCSRACDQFLLRVAPLGRVADDVGEADQVAVVVADHRDRAGDEDQRAVLADAPAFDFMLVFLHGQFQRAVRLAGAALVRPVEYAEMLADDFFRGVADDLLGGAVPARHASRRVEHENGVVDDAFDQDLEMPLGAVERQVRLGDFAVQLVLHREQMRFACRGAWRPRRPERAAAPTRPSTGRAATAAIAFKSAFANGLTPAEKPHTAMPQKMSASRCGIALVAAQRRPTSAGAGRGTPSRLRYGSRPLRLPPIRSLPMSGTISEQRR